jgi:hypothetical protein
MKTEETKEETITKEKLTKYKEKKKDIKNNISK